MSERIDVVIAVNDVRITELERQNAEKQLIENKAAQFVTEMGKKVKKCIDSRRFVIAPDNVMIIVVNIFLFHGWQECYWEYRNFLSSTYGRHDLAVERRFTSQSWCFYLTQIFWSWLDYIPWYWILPVFLILLVCFSLDIILLVPAVIVHLVTIFVSNTFYRMVVKIPFTLEELEAESEARVHGTAYKEAKRQFESKSVENNV